jgi:hypothetical protein
MTAAGPRLTRRCATKGCKHLRVSHANAVGACLYGGCSCEAFTWPRS